jgi:hypothetical protein
MGVNLSPVDRTIRIVLGVALAGIGLFVLRGFLGVALAVISAVLIFSGTVVFCHVYKFFGICTLPKKP